MRKLTILKIIPSLITLMLVLLFTGKGLAQSKTFANWAENKDGIRKLCFYPTTLRMINLSKDESFNRMVKDIDKLKIIISEGKGRVDKGALNTLKSGMRAEDYKDMIQLKRGKESFLIYMKEKNDRPVGFAGIVFSDTNLILIDLEGYISPVVIQQLIEGKINLGAISKLYDISKSDQDNQKPPKKQ